MSTLRDEAIKILTKVIAKEEIDSSDKRRADICLGIIKVMSSDRRRAGDNQRRGSPGDDAGSEEAADFGDVWAESERRFGSG